MDAESLLRLLGRPYHNTAGVIVTMQYAVDTGQFIVSDGRDSSQGGSLAAAFTALFQKKKALADGLILAASDYQALAGAASAPATHTLPDRLLTGETLPVGDHITSPDGSCLLSLQTDGNLVIYEGSVAVWNSSTYNHPEASFLEMQPNGLLVLWDRFGLSLWAAPVARGKATTGSSLVLQNDRNLVIYAPDGHPIWSSQTGDL